MRKLFVYAILKIQPQRTDCDLYVCLREHACDLRLLLTRNDKKKLVNGPLCALHNRFRWMDDAQPHILVDRQMEKCTHLQLFRCELDEHGCARFTIGTGLDCLSRVMRIIASENHDYLLRCSLTAARFRYNPWSSPCWSQWSSTVISQNDIIWNLHKNREHKPRTLDQNAKFVCFFLSEAFSAYCRLASKAPSFGRLVDFTIFSLFTLYGSLVLIHFFTI